MFEKTKAKIKWGLFISISTVLLLHFVIVFFQFAREIKSDYLEKNEVICNQIMNGIAVKIEENINTIEFYNQFKLSKQNADGQMILRNFENITQINQDVVTAFIVTDNYKYFYNRLMSEEYKNIEPLQKLNKINKSWKIIDANGRYKLLYITRIIDGNGNAAGMTAFIFSFNSVIEQIKGSNNIFNDSAMVLIGDGNETIDIGNNRPVNIKNFVCKTNIDNMSIFIANKSRYIFKILLYLLIWMIILFALITFLLYFILNKCSEYIYSELIAIRERVENFLVKTEALSQKKIKKRWHYIFDRFPIRTSILTIVILSCFVFSGILTLVIYRYSYDAVVNEYAIEYSDFLTEEICENVYGVANQINSVCLDIQSVSSSYLNLHTYDSKKAFIDELLNAVISEKSEISALQFTTGDGIVGEISLDSGVFIGNASDEFKFLRNNTLTILNSNIINNGKSYCMLGKKIFNYSSNYDFGNIICLIPSEKMIMVNEMLKNEEDIYFVTKGDEIISHTDQDKIGKEVYLPKQYLMGNKNVFKSKQLDGHMFSEPIYANSIISTEKFVVLINHIAYRSIILYITTTFLIVLLALVLSKKLLLDIKLTKDNMENLIAGKHSIQKRHKDSEFVFLNQSFSDMVKRIEELIEGIEEEKDKQKVLELELLQAQINPHFIYNVLDTISWEAKAVGQYKIDNMILSLENYLRKGLHMKENTITVGDEISHVKSYLDLEKYRFGAFFEAAFLVDDNIYNKQILKTLLQPIVENCVKHAFDKTRTDGLIIIKASKENTGIRFTVQDNGKGFEQKSENYIPKSRKTGGGIGLKNVNERLILFYGSQSALQIKSSTGNGTEVSFWIPIKEE